MTFAGTVSAGGRTRYLVRASGPGVANRLEDAGYTVQRELAAGHVFVVRGPSEGADTLGDIEGVRNAVRDVRFELERPERTEAADTEDEPFFGLQWDKQVTEVSAAHDTATGDGRTIAVIDSGVDHDHPDLPNVATAQGRLFTEDEAGNLVVTTPGATGDVALPASDTTVYDEDCNDVGLAGGTVTETRAFADDVLDHGTHVAGIAAGARNDLGVVGTAPDAEVVPLRVFYWVESDVDTDGDDEPDTTVANLFASLGGILSAIDHAATLGVDAMNLSIGTAPIPPRANSAGYRRVSESVIQSATRRGSLVVVSAGNSDANLQRGGLFTWPNSMAGAMSISATGPNDERVFYSNYGTNEVSVGAPGGGYDTLEKTLAAPYLWELIYGPDDDGDPGDGSIDDGFEYPTFEDVDGSCEDAFAGLENTDPVDWPYPTNLVLSAVPPEFWGGDYYAYFAGTSMAAPQVTGTAALVREVAPRSSARQVEKAIEQGAENVDGESSADLGAGRLNCDLALDADVID